jgi:hypothetical protein
VRDLAVERQAAILRLADEGNALEELVVEAMS